jgi:V/A-type H+-transporting ATPase subunit B
VLGRELSFAGVYPPVTILPSLSRLMKDGIGKGRTRDDHPRWGAQLYAAYARTQDVRSLASVIGEEELSETDQRYLKFGRAFEKEFVNQGFTENRSIDRTLEIGWKLLSMLPKTELTRVTLDEIEKYYKGEDATN